MGLKFKRVATDSGNFLASREEIVNKDIISYNI
jgi:hypothetical protein